ncbi:MAG: metal-dependent hydrolase [Planctomycetaceae bacterium]|nr:metal-dependent hydrolase [Planctomycetaceae bacterium]
MPTIVTWLGHATWLVKAGADLILIDPFLDDNPAAPYKADKVSPNFILISHGHGDHVADAAQIAKRTGALVLANYEICNWLGAQGVKNTLAHNLGGGSQHSFGRVQFTLAHHSSSLPDGANGGNPSGFLLSLADGNYYFACDTGLFYDMKLIGERGLKLAVLPIGDLFTMGPDDALAAVKLLKPQHVVPSHFNTWPPIEQDAQVWSRRVAAETSTKPHVLKPGDTLILP